MILSILCASLFGATARAAQAPSTPASDALPGRTLPAKALPDNALPGGVLPGNALTGAAQGDTSATVATFRIVALGSSSTQGVGASNPSATYPAQLEKLFDGGYRGKAAISVVNRGIGGEDIDDMMKRLKADVLTRKPDLVIWQVGSNDPLRGVPLERFKSELRDGIGQLHAGGAEVLLMEPQWCPTISKVDGSSRFVAAVRDVGAETHVDVIRRFDLMHRWMTDGLVPQAALVGPDGLHMTDLSYAMLAKAVFDQISTRSVAFHDDMARTVSTRH